MKDTVIWKRFKEFDARNEPEYYPVEELKGRIDWKFQRVQPIEGESVIAVGILMLKYNTLVTHDDKFTINGREYAVAVVAHPSDFSRKYTEVWLK